MTLSMERAVLPGATVLVAEDDEDIREIIVFKLESAGYRTIAVDNGNAALSVTHLECPDLVVLDIDMPGLNGLTVCQQLRELPRTSRIPVMILSGRTRDLDVSQGRTMGAVDYMTKPFRPDDLVTRVREMLVTTPR
jgi:DNA-binding response OmpR family regulator